MRLEGDLIVYANFLLCGKGLRRVGLGREGGIGRAMRGKKRIILRWEGLENWGRGV